MHDSLTKHCRDFHLYALCVEEEAYEILSEMNWENTTLIRLAEIEDSVLLKAKANRTHLEYCWTLKPAALKHVMNAYPEAEYFAHLDADLCFFSNIDGIFNEDPDASLLLTDHRNSVKFLYTYKLTGRFNTGFVGCKNDTIGHTAVEWWKRKCLEWCYTDNNVKEKLFGDQRYVERWERLFGNVHVIESIGANTAFWNIDQFFVSLKDGKTYIEDTKLAFYHFSGVYAYNPKEFNLTWFAPLQESILEYIYKPYVWLLARAIEKVQKNHPDFSHGFTKRGDVPEKHYFHI